MNVKNVTKCNHIVGIPEQAYTQTLCPLCLGTGVYGGLEFNPAGRVTTVSGSLTVKQKVEKILTEKRRSSGYGLDYSKVRNMSVVRDKQLIIHEIHRCLEYLLQLQAIEKYNNVQFSSSAEISKVKNILVYSVPEDPRKLLAIVDIVTVSGAGITVTKQISIG